MYSIRLWEASIFSQYLFLLFVYTRIRFDIIADSQFSRCPFYWLLFLSFDTYKSQSATKLISFRFCLLCVSSLFLIILMNLYTIFSIVWFDVSFRIHVRIVYEILSVPPAVYLCVLFAFICCALQPTPNCAHFARINRIDDVIWEFDTLHSGNHFASINSKSINLSYLSNEMGGLVFHDARAHSLVHFSASNVVGLHDDLSKLNISHQLIYAPAWNCVCLYVWRQMRLHLIFAIFLSTFFSTLLPLHNTFRHICSLLTCVIFIIILGHLIVACRRECARNLYYRSELELAHTR